MNYLYKRSVFDKGELSDSILPSSILGLLICPTWWGVYKIHVAIAKKGTICGRAGIEKSARQKTSRNRGY